MEIESIETTQLLVSLNSEDSHIDDFIELVAKHGQANFRSVHYPAFHKRTQRYFIVLYFRSGSQGTVVGWGLCDALNSFRTGNASEKSAFEDIPYALPIDPSTPYSHRFRSVFNLRAVRTFATPVSVYDLTLVKTDELIDNLRITRNAVKVRLSDSEALQEIYGYLEELNMGSD
jgi:hypothetical protein